MHWDLKASEAHMRSDAKELEMGEKAARWVEGRELRLAGEVVEELLEQQRMVEGEVLLGS